MFDLTFIGAAPEPQDEGWSALRGQTTLGTFREEFLASLEVWQRADYERHWIEAAQRILGDADRTGFFTSAFQLWWVMWRQGDFLVMREQLLMEDALIEPLDPSNPYRQIPNYSSPGQDGTEVSEWRLTVKDLAGFVARRERQYVHV